MLVVWYPRQAGHKLDGFGCCKILLTAGMILARESFLTVFVMFYRIVPRMALILVMMHCITPPAVSVCEDYVTTADADHQSSHCSAPPTSADSVAFDWARARDEYFYLHKISATDLGENCEKRMLVEGRSDKVLVAHASLLQNHHKE